MPTTKIAQTPKEVYENAAAAIYYLEIESDINFHMPMGMDEEGQDDFNKNFKASIQHLHKLLECYYDLLDYEEKEEIEL